MAVVRLLEDCSFSYKAVIVSVGLETQTRFAVGDSQFLVVQGPKLTKIIVLHTLFRGQFRFVISERKFHVQQTLVKFLSTNFILICVPPKNEQISHNGLRK